MLYFSLSLSQFVVVTVEFVVSHVCRGTDVDLMLVVIPHLDTVMCPWVISEEKKIPQTSK